MTDKVSLFAVDWRGIPWADARGPVESILRLLQQEQITRRKAVELLTALHKMEREPRGIPWDKLNWSDERD